MADMQNTLKEMDIQVIYRRLEARKRNTSRDGRMSKRQIATAYRGYHGLESQYHALLQMSNASMINTKHKNDHVQTKHVEEMRHLIEQEKSATGKTEKDLKAMREDFTAQLAFQYVYKNHSFKRFYKSQQQKKPRPVSDKPELYELERRNSARLAGPRQLGSLREIEVYKDELKVKFPPIAHHKHPDDIDSPRVNMMGEKVYKDLESENKEDKQQNQEMTSFPNIKDAMGIHVKFKYKPLEDDRISAITAPPAGFDAESEDESSHNDSNLITFDMGQHLIQMRQKEKENLEKRRLLPQTPNTNRGKNTEKRKESWRRVLPETPSRPSTVFHGTRNTIEMKKIIKREATDVLNVWDNRSHHKEVAEIAKEHHKAKLAENPFPVFDRSRPTSAILQDYIEYKKHKEEELAMREEAEIDQTIIVRQMSPLPRAGSPVAETRNRYMHAGRSGLLRDASLHRTESEKFPSVSRTSSYKDVPGTDTRFQENALLTAAERIELEKEKRKKKSKAKDVPKQQSTQKVKRRLPTAPAASAKKVVRPAKPDVQELKPEPIKMFNTSILARDRDADMINRVKLANFTHEEGNRTAQPDKKHQVNKNNELRPYSPIVKQQKQQDGSSLKSGPSPFPKESVSRIKTASELYGQDLWPKLSRQMKFDYEHFSRTTPETKKRLETRAKNRKKIHQKNVQLAEELKMKAESKGAATKIDLDRPPTRVSFNENVIVFQTI